MGFRLGWFAPFRFDPGTLPGTVCTLRIPAIAQRRRETGVEAGRPLAQPGSAIDRPAYFGVGRSRWRAASACTLGNTDGANGAARGPDMSTLSSICWFAASMGSAPATCSVW